MAANNSAALAASPAIFFLYSLTAFKDLIEAEAVRNRAGNAGFKKILHVPLSHEGFLARREIPTECLGHQCGLKIQVFNRTRWGSFCPILPTNSSNISRSVFED
ncbi:hypothetical protein Adt_05010 [Abeliophyllum distichum]|uniref:Uncharacterized protein n=1 Tax=Abeliophyllum distichum TaxID=126358 RepID=A0ABD1V2W2_9LAMI